MSRRFQEKLEARREVQRLLREVVDSRGCAYVIAWLCIHFTDDGTLRSPSAAQRARLRLNGDEYWLVRIPRKRRELSP